MSYRPAVWMAALTITPTSHANKDRQLTKGSLKIARKLRLLVYIPHIIGCLMALLYNLLS